MLFLRWRLISEASRSRCSNGGGEEYPKAVTKAVLRIATIYAGQTARRPSAEAESLGQAADAGLGFKEGRVDLHDHGKVEKNTVIVCASVRFIILDCIRLDYNPHSCLGSRVHCSVPESRSLVRFPSLGSMSRSCSMAIRAPTGPCQPV